MTTNSSDPLEVTLRELIEQAMQDGFDVAMGGSFDKTPEENKAWQEAEYDKLVKQSVAALLALLQSEITKAEVRGMTTEALLRFKARPAQQKGTS